MLASNAQDATLRFLSMADWGGQDGKPYYTPGEKNVGKSVATIVNSDHFSFILAVGDNFYSHGIHTDENDPRFKETFEDVFDGDDLKDMPFYVVSGNHDHYVNLIL